MVSNLTVITPITKMAGRLNLLESWVLNALCLGIKVVLIHDFREESTQNELEQLVNRYGTEELVLISGSFGSPGAARNAGMKNLNSEWVCFWDSDDLPNVSKVLLEINSCDPSTDVIIGQYSIVDKSGKFDPFWSSTTCNFEDFALNPGLWRILIRTKLVEAISFPSLRMGEDQVFLSRLNIEVLKVKFCSQVFYNYYIGEPSQLTNNWEAIADLNVAIQELCNSTKLKSSEYYCVNSIMLTRMCVTAIVKGKFNLKVKSISPLMQALKKLGPRKSWVVLKKISRAG